MKSTAKLQVGDTVVIKGTTYTLTEKSPTWGRTASYGTRMRTDYNLVLKSVEDDSTMTMGLVSPNKMFEIAQ